MATVRIRDANACECVFKLFCNHTSLVDNDLLSCTIWCTISLARASWELRCPIFLSFQLWSPRVVALNLRARVSRGYGLLGTECQACWIASWNPSQTWARRTQSEIFISLPDCHWAHRWVGSSMSPQRPHCVEDSQGNNAPPSQPSKKPDQP